ncbi:MAG: peptide-methionine (S)-S-oxide reductase [Bacteriovorax sp. MedPE-SWde]|nr:MAG: peptide-methionine (S)-S-oxide reductase [Bacteriovorax sp. MedPE-SWde]
MSEVAIFGAGCFWGVEEKFRQLQGVSETEVGYCGGDLPEPSYEEICRGTTGHAEVVKVTFDPERITYKSLLSLFWSSHNPMELNRQGPDVGTQYRSVIFYTTDEQKIIAQEALKDLEANGGYKAPIVTTIVAEYNYHPAEEYHQKYLHKRGQMVCGL